MADYQRIVEFLRDFRTSTSQQVTDEVRQYASEYAELCQKANERLRQCSTFLQQGLRSEAIHLAEQSPNLLDMVAALDLPDGQAWSDFCQQYDLPVAPAIMIERATQLNDAYGQDEPLEILLRSHRRMALSRAAVKNRLDVMRQISSMDPGSAFWEKDIRLFETARLRELRAAFATAVKDRNEQAMSTLADEVLQSPWLEAVPEDLLTACSGLSERLRLAAVDMQMRDLLDKLRSAFGSKSLNDCVSLIDQIKKTLADAGQQGVSTQVAAELKPILAWINEANEEAARQKAHASACDAFSAALDADAPDNELEALLAKLKEFPHPVPEILQQRFDETMRKRTTASSRKYWMGLAAVAAVIILGLVGFYLHRQSAEAAGWANKIQAANKLRDLGQAKRLISEQEQRAPQFSAAPEVAAAKKETVAIQLQHDQDAAMLKDLLARIDKEKSAAELVSNAQEASLDDLLNAVGQIEDSLKVHQGDPDLAWVDAEGKIAAGIKLLKVQGTLLQDRAARVAASRIDVLSQKVSAAIDSPGEPSAQLSKLDEIASQIEPLRKLSRLSEETKSAIAAMVGKIDQKRQALGQSMDQISELKNLRRRVATADELAKAMQSFIEKFPNAPVTQDFTKALERKDSMKDVEAWRELLTSWNRQLTPPTEAAAKQRIQQLQTYFEAHPHSPILDVASAYSDYLAQAAVCLAVNNVWQSSLKDLLTTPMMTDLKYLAASNGRKYFVMGDIKLQSRKLINEGQVVSFDAVDPSNVAKRIRVTIAPPISLVSDQPQQVPHAKFAEAMLAQMRLIDPENWDTFGVTQIEQIARDKEMDLVVKALLLQEVIQVTKKVSGWGIGDVYDRTLDVLLKQAPDSIPWYDSEHPLPAATIQALKKVFDNLPSPDAVRKQITAKRTQLFKSVGDDFAGIGALMRDDSGAWTIYTTATEAEGNVALAVALAPTTAPAADAAASAGSPVIKVAEFKAGKYVVDEAAVKDLPQGTMVFIRKP